jgi:hypothetical protein
MEVPLSQGTAELILGMGNVLIGTVCCVFTERLATWNKWCTKALFGVRISPTGERVHFHFTRWGGLTVALWGIAVLVFDVP